MAARRDWSFARAKIDAERRCRVCQDTVGVEAAHTIGRRHDTATSSGVLVVIPHDVVPLCRTHHAAYDKHELDLLPYLSFEEQAAAVSHVGIISAMRRLTSTH